MTQTVFWVLVGAWVALEVFLHVAHDPRIRQTNGEKLSRYVRPVQPIVPWVI